MSHKHEVYISTTVLEELDENLFENFWLTLTKEHITSFIEKSQIKISPSHELQQSYTSYVNDFDDAQILQDAVDIHAQFLISRNISDFNIWKIQEDFDIKILGYIPEELL